MVCPIDGDELVVFLHKRQFDGASRAVPLLGDDQLRVVRHVARDECPRRLTEHDLSGVAGIPDRRRAAELQAAGLCARVRAAGGEALPWPAIRIAPLEVPPEATDQPVPDWALFVSANAVRHGLGGLPPGPRIAAIGPATAAALLAAGRPHAVVRPLE